MNETNRDMTGERFRSDTPHHQMTILLDQGLHRHLRFQRPGSSIYWFELIAVPGSLTFRGDGESFVFARNPDMFEFFRSNPDRNTMPISPDYWAEKLTSCRESAKTYSRALLERNVADLLAEAEKDWPGVTDEWKSETDDSIDYDLDYEDGAREALRDFSYTIPGRDGKFEFGETWEWDLRDFDWWYLWACHAIVWGIAQYDAAKTAAAPVAEAVAA